MKTWMFQVEQKDRQRMVSLGKKSLKIAKAEAKMFLLHYFSCVACNKLQMINCHIRNQTRKS